MDFKKLLSLYCFIIKYKCQQRQNSFPFTIPRTKVVSYWSNPVEHYYWWMLRLYVVKSYAKRGAAELLQKI